MKYGDMNGSLDMLEEKRTKLYGPQRDVSLQNFRSRFAKDNVLEALQSGEYKFDGKSNAWLTSAKESYRHQEPTKSNDAKLTAESRNATSFTLGFDKVTYMTTTEDYKSHGMKCKPESIVNNMNKSLIPDFCPEYAKSRHTEPSEYQVKYKVDSNQPPQKYTTSEDRKKHTNDLRATHFQLGSCSDSKTSETGHSFCEITTKEPPKMDYASERCKSTVFRAGDWNSNGRKMIKESVTKSDFTPCSETRIENEVEDEIMSKLYQRATHFKLGSAEDKDDSIYTKDFLAAPNVTTYRPSIASAPVPALVIPNDCADSGRFKSTLQRNFGRPDRDIMLELKEERKNNCTENKMRMAENSVPISFKVPKQLIPQQLKSTTACHFHQPLEKEDNRAYFATGRTEFNHLNGSYNSPKARQSETKASYLGSPVDCRDLRAECHRQFADNITTHFDFGIDDEQPVSEHLSQYRQRQSVDPTLRAAGKSLLKTKDYCHIEQETRNIGTSVMKRDYKRVSCEDICEKGRPKPVGCPTHFFHMDNDFQGTQNSATKDDFKSPETI